MAAGAIERKKKIERERPMADHRTLQHGESRLPEISYHLTPGELSRDGKRARSRVERLGRVGGSGLTKIAA
ncbi:hypothetical protein RRG08_055243 [Elysia crispata]|uniref:Uncharacterized protein n=1 Tax=Elysia crispata TaxID=231223 RepID=A0AAE1CMC6_9GAST|nr:hypothetical protein RRG08_055243 [Elysia crispata]